jgi:hypothetical protein
MPQRTRPDHRIPQIPAGKTVVAFIAIACTLVGFLALM